MFFYLFYECEDHRLPYLLFCLFIKFDFDEHIWSNRVVCYFSQQRISSAPSSFVLLRGSVQSRCHSRLALIWHLLRVGELSKSAWRYSFCCKPRTEELHWGQPKYVQTVLLFEMKTCKYDQIGSNFYFPKRQKVPNAGLTISCSGGLWGYPLPWWHKQTN